MDNIDISVVENIDQVDITIYEYTPPSTSGSTSSSTSAGAVSFNVYQNNTFSNYSPIYFDGNIWQKAQSDTENTLGTAITSDVTSTSFTVNIIGKFLASSHGLGSAGQYIYTASSSAGVFVTTAPSTNVNPLGYIYDTDNIIAMPWRASKGYLNFDQLGDTTSYTGNAGKALIVNATSNGITTATLPVQIAVDGGLNTNVSFSTATNTYTVAYSGAGNPTNPFPMTVMSSQAATPTTGTIHFYFESICGRPIIHAKDEFGTVRRFQRSFSDGPIFKVTPGQSNLISSEGATPVTVGTITHPTPSSNTFGFTSNFATTDAVANQALSMSHRAAAMRIEDGFFYESLLYFPDSTYGAGSTGSRIFAGFTDQSNMSDETGSDDRASQRAGFHISSNLAETTWKFTVKGTSATENRIDTNTTFKVGKLFRYTISALPNSTVIHWRIENITDSIVNSSYVSLGIPDSTKFMRCGFSLTTLTSQVRNVGHSITVVERV